MENTSHWAWNTAGRPLCPLLWETQPILTTFIWVLLGDTIPKRSKVKRAALWLCGMESVGKEPPSKVEPVIVSLEENPLVKTLLDINLITCVSCAFFLWGYLAQHGGEPRGPGCCLCPVFVMKGDK